MKELAQMVGVSEATVSQWESGNLATMKHTKIMLLSNALGISPAALFDSAPEPPAQALKLTDQEKSLIVKIHPPSGWLLFFGHSPIFSSHT